MKKFRIFSNRLLLSFNYSRSYRYHFIKHYTYDGDLDDKLDQSLDKNESLIKLWETFKEENKKSPFLSFQNALKLENITNTVEDVDEGRAQVMNIIAEEFG